MSFMFTIESCKTEDILNIGHDSNFCIKEPEMEHCFVTNSPHPHKNGHTAIKIVVYYKNKTKCRYRGR